MTDEWTFERGDIVREDTPSISQDRALDAPDEYKIKRRLRDVDDTAQERFYHVEKENDGSQLFSQSALRANFEQIPEDESRVWPKDERGLFD